MRRTNERDQLRAAVELLSEIVRASADGMTPMEVVTYVTRMVDVLKPPRGRRAAPVKSVGRTPTKKAKKKKTRRVDDEGLSVFPEESKKLSRALDDDIPF